MAYFNKVDNAQKIYAEELRKVGQSAENWKDFLDFTAKTNLTDNPEVSEFSSKVIIHAYNPNAVDCRTFDDWKRQEGNHVNRHEKGMPVLSRDRDGKVRVAHVFDTSQTALPKLPQMPEFDEISKANLKRALQEEIRKFTDNPRFSDEQKRLFAQTAEYKLSKQYGLETSENAERFSGIERLSVNEKAFIGIALNGCSRSFAQIADNERRISNERINNSKSRDDRTELHGRERRGMDMGGRVSGTRNEVPIRRENEAVVQAERGKSDIRTSDRDTRTEAHSGNGQVWQSAAEIHMADTVSDRSVNAGRENGRSEALRGDERASFEPDRRDSGKEEAISGVQGVGGIGEIPAEGADVGTVQSTGGGRNTSRDGVRNIEDNETAEPEKGSAVSDLSDNANSHEYPYVTVQAGRNYDLLIAPELEEKDYSVAEFNAALNKLNERWNDEEYEGKTAFVNLTIHLSETETFEKRLYAEYQFDSLSERLEFDNDIFDKEVKLRQAVREAENKAEHKQETPEYTGIEKAFLNSDISAFMTKAVLSWDEIESIGYRLYEKGYNDRYPASEKAIFGNGMHEPELYGTAKKMQNGEDIRRELSSALLGGQANFTTAKGNEFKVEYGSEYITARYGNAEKQISYEDMGNAFLKLIEDEHKDIVHGRTVEDLQYVIPDLKSETAEKLITAFDSAARPDWENNFQKQQGIKRALYDILGDEEQTNKAFDSIADMKYNYKPEPVKEDSLEFHFGRGKDDDWISESDLVRDFALANPDCSFALGNAVLEYLDEKQHTERNIPKLKAGWYKKTDFDITATIGGEDFHYEGRFDIGDGKGTGGGSLIDHIRDFNQGIMDYSGYPYNTPEAKEQAKNTLEILVPFLEKNAVLTEKEQEILAEFKAANPIRSYEDIEKETSVETPENIPQENLNNEATDKSLSEKSVSEAIEEKAPPSVQKTADELKVGDVIKYDGNVWRISDIQGDFSVKLENTDTNSANASRGFWGNWKENLDKEGFEYVPVKDVIEQGLYETQTTPDKPKKDFISDGQMSMFGDVPSVEDSADEKTYQVVVYSNDSGAEYKGNFAEMDEAVEDGRNYLYNRNFDDYYSGLAILNTKENKVEYYEGDFPLEGIFSNEIYQNSGEWYRVEPNQNLKELKDEQLEMFHAERVTVTHSEPVAAPVEENKKIEAETPEHTDTERQELVKAVIEKAAEVLSDSKELEQAYSANGKKEKVFGNSFVQKDFKMECEIAFGNFFMSACRGEVEGLENVKSLFNDFRENAEFRQSVYNEVSNMVAAAFDSKNVREQSECKENTTAEKDTSAVAENIPHSEPTVNDVSEAVEQPKEKPDYFRITDEHLGEGSRREKYANNVAAIKTLKQLEEEERPATPEEQETLSKYIGWGGLQEAFDRNDTSWSKEYYELQNLLSEDEYEAARATVGDAFYTSPVITNAIYEGLSNIGFKGGEVLEPSMGVGNFFGTMPDGMRDNSNLSGVEIDNISGRIAQKLYPEASIAINAFEKVKPSKGAFDVAVGNVPFGNHGVNDKTKAYKGLLIHDYFFAKSLDSVRSGGVVAFVTSTGTLDKEDTKVRQMLAQKAELMGAVRLPNNAFQKNAGTQTSTDIIFLKKREKPLNIGDMAADKSCDWVHTKTNADGYKINSYFADNPEMVLGNLSDKGRFGSIICTPVQGADLKEQLHEAMKNIKGEYVPLEFQAELDERAEDKYIPATPDIENLTYTVVEDKLYFRVDDNLIPLKESEQHGAIADRRKAMCGLGETTRELLKAQVEDRSDSEIKLLQAELNTKYDFFVKKFGRINPIETPNARNASGVTRKSANSNAFKNDVRLPLLQSLEQMKEGQFVGKAEIFTERTIRPRQVAEHVETSQEALILSMSEKGKVDFGYMEKLTGFDQKKLVDDLHGEIFPVPYSLNEYQTADEYLSGNIYKKIAQAEECIAVNPEFAENIAALKQVIPTPLKATEIDMQLGMTWIDPKIIQQFMYETFDTSYKFQEYKKDDTEKNPNAITVSYSGSGKGSWKIHNARLDNSVKATKNFGTKDFNAYELLEKILNSKSPAVTQTYRDSEGKTKTVILEKETKAAEDKVKLINAEFKKWIFADPERRNELVKTYNEKFNCIRPREYDGSHLNFFGSNPEITLKPHQKNAVSHALFGGNTLFAHEVGSGKTFEMIATAMEGKRLGLHSKSMFVVPNHLTEQIGSDFMKLYPNANILVAKPDDFSPQKRRQMCARIATGNFDAVIIGHSQLIKIPLSPKREEEFIRNQINDIMVSLEAAKETDSKSYTVKQLEATRKNLRDRLEKLTNSTVKDNAVTFEELGVDKLFVDEAHEFKNLYVSTKMKNVSGLSTNADVQKTQDLYLKCQYLDEITGSKGIVFSTGTPVTNALSEMYTMQKYLQSDLLKETGLDSFDSWAGNFTRKSTETEISPSGSDWRMKTRLKFTNVPELVTMFKECADVKMADQLNLDVPECSKNIVSVEPTLTQKAVVQSLAERAEKISSGAVSRTEDNMLVVTGDGRKLGLDQRLFDLSLPDEPQSKLNACVNNVHDIWASTANKKSTQLIFCDLGVPQSKEDLKKNGERFDVYADIRKKLIDKGIPEKEIAFIHEAASETEKAKLFAKVRSGDVRVLIGSTQKMGAGTNVQNKLIALHDLDCPWRPADLTQRLGRMVRQGNENDRVHNFRYVTKGTFDAYLYQMVEKKQESISQIFTSKAISRTCDDIDDMAVDFMQVKMAAVGDDRIRRQMELREDIRGLNMLRNTYLENKYELEDNIRELPKKIERAEKLVENIADDVKKIENYKAPRDIDGKEIYQMKIGGETFTDKKEAAAAFTSAMTTAIAKNPKNPTEIAEYKGFKIAVSYDPFTRVHHGTLKGAADYPFELGSSESGNLTRIDNVIASVPKRTDVVCNDIERMKNELADSIKEVNTPFSHEAELVEKKQELERLTEEIEADKVNGKIAPEQPENTADIKDTLPEKQTDNSENIPENTAENFTEKSSEDTLEKNNSPEKTNDTASSQQSEKSEAATVVTKKDVPEEKPETFNIKWIQSGKKIRISFDSSAENPITAFADGKATGTCKPEELVVTKIPDNEKKHYPVGITHCIKPLNIAFGSSIAEHIKKFADKVKEICNKIKGKEKTLFSREKIMSDKYKPTSSKDDKKQQNEHSQSM